MPPFEQRKATLTGATTMGNYSITHTCGHTATHTLCGPHKRRTKRGLSISRQPCIDCLHQGQSGVNAAEYDSRNLPRLSGSAEQNERAEKIRREATTQLRRIERKLAQEAMINAQKVNAATKLLLEIAEALGQRDSQWWIDHRFTEFDAYWVAEQLRHRAAEKQRKAG